MRQRAGATGIVFPQRGLQFHRQLLRFLQERVLERVGGREEIAVDTRVICATHQDLRSQIRDNRFREDLYYRISEVSVQIPPLRDRIGDTVMIARALLGRMTDMHRGRIKDFSDAAVKAMQARNRGTTR